MRSTRDDSLARGGDVNLGGIIVAHVKRLDFPHTNEKKVQQAVGLNCLVYLLLL